MAVWICKWLKAGGNHSHFYLFSIFTGNQPILKWIPTKKACQYVIAVKVWFIIIACDKNID